MGVGVVKHFGQPHCAFFYQVVGGHRHRNRSRQRIRVWIRAALRGDDMNIRAAAAAGENDRPAICPADDGVHRPHGDDDLRVGVVRPRIVVGAHGRGKQDGLFAGFVDLTYAQDIATRPGDDERRILRRVGQRINNIDIVKGGRSGESRQRGGDGKMRVGSCQRINSDPSDDIHANRHRHGGQIVGRGNVQFMIGSGVVEIEFSNHGEFAVFGVYLVG